jgi:hypothetical protein
LKCLDLCVTLGVLMSKGRGMRGYDGSTVPTNRVQRSASYVQVRTVAKVQLRTNSKSSKIRVSYNADAIARALSIISNGTVRS